MASNVGNTANPLRVAVFGAGPAGFYAVEDLLKQERLAVAVDLFDRLPTPYGLVRGGVAPDHQKIKSVIKQYEKTAARSSFRFFGNVTFGQDFFLADVLRHYHQVLFTTGAETDRHLGIPGESLPGSWPATEFVWWYNGHPDCRDLEFDLSGVERVAVVGNGNVAMDVARVLAKFPPELEQTDIADYALDVLRKSNVKEIYLLGRRGPAQAAFTNPEIRELADIEGVDLVVSPEELELDEFSRESLAQAKEKTHQRNVDILKAQIDKGEGTQQRKIRARFFASPVEIFGKEHVEGVRLEKNRLVQDETGALKARGTGEYEDISVQMIFRSIGYKGVALPDVPFDERNGVIPNQDGRVLDPHSGAPFARLYVAGWIKRGPSGVIGTNKADAADTVKAMLADASHYQPAGDFQPDPEAIPALLAKKGVRAVTFADWKRIDEVEIARGKPHGKPREKLTRIPELLAAIDGAEVVGG